MYWIPNLSQDQISPYSAISNDLLNNRMMFASHYSKVNLSKIVSKKKKIVS